MHVMSGTPEEIIAALEKTLTICRWLDVPSGWGVEDALRAQAVWDKHLKQGNPTCPCLACSTARRMKWTPRLEPKCEPQS